MKGAFHRNAAGMRGFPDRLMRPGDALELLPMSDGGDGFGEVMYALYQARRGGIAE